MSPLEIPGDILKELPDRSSAGNCAECRRPYYKLKIYKKGSYTDLHCPYCGKRIKREKHNKK